jgi:acetolactate synthase-1/2/3 large subunit
MRHPLFQADDVLAEADVVLVLDAEVPWVHGQHSPPSSAHITAVGFDPIKLRLPIHDFVADVRLTASPLLTIEALLRAVKLLLTDELRQRIVRRIAKLHADSGKRIASIEAEARSTGEKDPIDKAWIGYQLGQILDDKCIVFDDTLGHNRVSDYLSCSRPGSYFANPGSSGGWSPGAAFGAKLGAPDRDMIAVTGDGFYMFGTPATALWAAAHHDAPFMAVVYTNRSYTTGTSSLKKAYGARGYAERDGFQGGYFDPPIDFAKEAEAAGAYGETVRNPADLGHALRRGLDHIRNGRCAVISVWMERLEAGN